MSPLLHARMGAHLRLGVGVFDLSGVGGEGGGGLGTIYYRQVGHFVLISHTWNDGCYRESNGGPGFSGITERDSLCRPAEFDERTFTLRRDEAKHC